MHRIHARVQLDVRIGSPKITPAFSPMTPSHVATNPPSEEALIAPIDTKVSIDTIVQWICLLGFWPNRNCASHPNQSGTRNAQSSSGELTLTLEEPKDYWAARGYSHYDGI
jgi:hypothetical protein